MRIKRKPLQHKEPRTSTSLPACYAPMQHCIFTMQWGGKPHVTLSPDRFSVCSFQSNKSVLRSDSEKSWMDGGEGRGLAQRAVLSNTASLPPGTGGLPMSEVTLPNASEPQQEQISVHLGTCYVSACLRKQRRGEQTASREAQEHPLSHFTVPTPSQDPCGPPEALAMFQGRSYHMIL